MNGSGTSEPRGECVFRRIKYKYISFEIELLETQNKLTSFQLILYWHNDWSLDSSTEDVFLLQTNSIDTIGVYLHFDNILKFRFCKFSCSFRDLFYINCHPMINLLIILATIHVKYCSFLSPSDRWLISKVFLLESSGV